ncbi:MAG: hypothetical protein U0Z44_17065 [Kouleothrix sp.]|nr:hypothetical protein [Kouleothrix sp.]
MIKRHSPRRAATSAPGVKLLITTTALAATLGGWVGLARQMPAEPLAALQLPSPTERPIAERPSQPRQLQLAPIPTLAAPPPPPPELAIAKPPVLNLHAAPAAAAAPAAPAPAAPAAAAAPAAPAPVAAPAAPPLRVVSPPPAPAPAPVPVARTRSSK